jgi:hypothetical protein
MRRRSLAATAAVLPLLLPAPADAEPGHDAAPSPDPGGVPEPADPDPTAVTGTVVDRISGETLSGATVVVSIGDRHVTAITDDHGRYQVDVAGAGPARVRVYYGDAAVERPIVLGDRALEVPPIHVDTSAIATGWALDTFAPLIEQLDPPAGARVDGDDSIVTRTATVAGLRTPLPIRAVELRLDGAPRLRGAPALSLMFVDDATVRVHGDGHGAGEGVLAVAPILGRNDRTTQVRGAAGLDGGARGEIAALVSGPVRRDRAWWVAGVDLRDGGGGGSGQAVGGVTYAASVDHQLRVLGVVTRGAWPGVPTGGAPLTAARRVDEPPPLADDWADATWRSRLEDARTTVEIGATGHALTDAAGRRHRAGLRAALTRRARLAGYHRTEAGVEAGTGAAADGATRDLRVHVGDAWTVSPSVEVRAGVVSDRRIVGDHDRVAILPHAALSWDPGGDGRGRWFVELSRRADREAAPADAAAPWTELLAGGQRQLGDDLALGGAWRRRGDLARRDDVAAWAVWRAGTRGPTVRASAGTRVDADPRLRGDVQLGHAMTVCIGELFAAAGATRDPEAAIGDVTGSFVAGWRTQGRDPGYEVVLDAHAGDGGAVRLAATARW